MCVVVCFPLDGTAEIPMCAFSFETSLCSSCIYHPLTRSHPAVDVMSTNAIHGLDDGEQVQPHLRFWAPWTASSINFVQMCLFDYLCDWLLRWIIARQNWAKESEHQESLWACHLADCLHGPVTC